MGLHRGHRSSPKVGKIRDPLLLSLQCLSIHNPNYFFSSLVHACDSDPCKNGAICDKQGDGFNCLCTDGYKGELCEDKGECLRQLT
jgi:hypothetical protein